MDDMHPPRCGLVFGGFWCVIYSVAPPLIDCSFWISFLNTKHVHEPVRASRATCGPPARLFAVLAYSLADEQQTALF